MKDKEIQLAFHYLSLHKSEYYTNAEQNTPELPNCDRYADTLVRLPLYCGLAPDQDTVFAALKESLAS